MSMTQVPQSLNRLRVLVVDDEADIREFITVVLESQGMSVKAVASAAAAFEVLVILTGCVGLRHPDAGWPWV